MMAWRTGVSQRLSDDTKRGDFDRGWKCGKSPIYRSTYEVPTVSLCVTCVSAPASPSSSSAGGRSPSTTRRSSGTVARSSVRNASSSSSAGETRRGLRRSGRGEADARESWAEPVVEVAPQPAPLLLTCEHQRSSAPCRASRAAGREGRCRCVPRDRRAGVDPGPAAASAEADTRASQPVRHRPTAASSRGRSGELDMARVTGHDSTVMSPLATSRDQDPQFGDNVRQQAIDIDGCLESLTQFGEHVVGLVPSSESQSVDPSL